MPPRLHIITLGVHDFERALRFYRDGLGWTPSAASQGDIAFFDAGGVVLALHPREALAADAGVPAVGSGFNGLTLAHNVASREAVDAVIRAVEAAGATVVKAPEEAFWGGYSGYFADPEGQLWEVAHNPFFPFDDAGRIVLP
ncbi:MAG: VOC family protein [Anaerolineae bacterium]